MQPVTLARHAMATRFELVLHGENSTALRAAGEEALDEIDQLEKKLSLYWPGSEIAQVNARAAREAVRVTPEVFALLQHAQRLHAETGGAFDITIAPLVRCWGFMGGTGNMPTPEEVAEARTKVGMSHVHLDPQNRTVRFARDGVMLDLGAIGKGYAAGQAAEILRAAGVTSALIHGGTSTVYAIGRQPDGEAWKVAIEQPPAPNLVGTRSTASQTSSRTDGDAGGTRPYQMQREVHGVGANLPSAVPLRDEAMSVSAIWGRSFEVGGQSFGHVIDPRTGQPVSHSLLAVVVLPSATETDALSTALLTLGGAGHESIARLRPGMRTVLVTQTESGMHAETNGFDALPGSLPSP